MASAGWSGLFLNPLDEMTHPISENPAPTKKCIPGMSGRTDLMVDATVDDGGMVVAKVARMVAYIEEPIAPVSSVMEPTAPSRAPDCPGGARLASRACKAGIDTVGFVSRKDIWEKKETKERKK
jgi:hypothetical protein